MAKDKASIRAITAIITYFCATGIFVSIFWGVKAFLFTPLTSIGFATIKTPVRGTASPNVLRTVAELNEATIKSSIESIIVGFFLTAVIAILLFAITAAILVKKKGDKNKIINYFFYGLVLTIWIGATLYSTTKGVRFALLMVPAISIGFGAFIGIIINLVASLITRLFIHANNREFDVVFEVVKFIFKAFMFLLVLFVLFTHPRLEDSRAHAANDAPIMNDAWNNVLTSIKNNSEENAIITSWWDFGHQFKAIADRPVTFDGATQDTPQAHWVGRFFATDDEAEAIGILRMLDCGGGSLAVERIEEELRKIKGSDNNEDHFIEALRIAKRMIPLDAEMAKRVLLEAGVGRRDLGNILELTHCAPPEAFVIASNDMIAKAGVWSHFGGWNYTKADVWSATRELPREEAVGYMKQKHQISEEEADRLFLEMQSITDDRAADEWISPWPRIAGETLGCALEEEIATCAGGIIINVEQMDAWIPTQGDNMRPASLVYLNETTIVERKYENDVIPERLSVLLIPERDSFEVLLASEYLIDSTFVKMFFLNGHGLKYFKPLTRETGPGMDVWVWQADWEGKQENLLPAAARGNESEA